MGNLLIVTVVLWLATGWARLASRKSTQYEEPARGAIFLLLFAASFIFLMVYLALAIWSHSLL